MKTLRHPRLRPTSDKVREALFSILESTTSSWDLVLDLYAGSGALGIEALSRYSREADFVEENPRHCALIRENLLRTGFESQGEVYCRKVEKALGSLNRSYDIIFMDPPYGDPSITPVLERLAVSPVAGEGATLMVEHSRHHPLAPTYGPFVSFTSRRYGDTCITFYRREKIG